MNCQHQNTRKMFFQNPKGKWNKTEYAICLDCGEAISKKIIIKSITKFHKEAEDNLRDCVAKGNNSDKIKLIKKKLGFN